MSLKEDVHRLVDKLPEDELPVAQRYLAALLAKETDPLLHALMQAPVDDEPTTLEEDEGAAEAWQEYQRGEGRPLREVRAARTRG